jgi:signal transduction histidine kinase
VAADIRDQGNQLTKLAEELVAMEHRAINNLLRIISNSLLLMLPLLIIFFGTIAALLGRGIVSSLKQLEKHADMIATGNFIEVPFTSSSREVNNLINAFNRMSRELKSRQQQLVRSEKLASLGTMLAGVAHEFNNPLSNISSSAQILNEEIGEDKNSFARDLLNQITAEASRASSIIKTLLSLARHETFHRDHYPLKPLLHEILALLHGQLAKDVDIQLAIPNELSIFADKQKIQQVFLNLLKNSMDALGGKGVIQIQAWQNQTEIKIVVSDDGPGMSDQVKKKIFDPFFTTKYTGQGSGLGLFIIHDIIIQHGGTITVESIKGKGTAFTIILPATESV